MIQKFCMDDLMVRILTTISDDFQKNDFHEIHGDFTVRSVFFRVFSRIFTVNFLMEIWVSWISWKFMKTQNHCEFPFSSKTGVFMHFHGFSWFRTCKYEGFHVFSCFHVFSRFFVFPHRLHFHGFPGIFTFSWASRFSGTPKVFHMQFWWCWDHSFSWLSKSDCILYCTSSIQKNIFFSPKTHHNKDVFVARERNTISHHKIIDPTIKHVHQNKLIHGCCSEPYTVQFGKGEKVDCPRRFSFCNIPSWVGGICGNMVFLPRKIRIVVSELPNIWEENA